MAVRYWNLVDEGLPENGTFCDTISKHGQEQRLVYKDGLWYFPGYSMYVYYTPMFWKKVEV